MIKKLIELQLKRLDNLLTKTIAKKGEKQALQKYIKYYRNILLLFPIMLFCIIFSSLSNGFFQLNEYFSNKNTLTLILMIIFFITAFFSLLLALFVLIIKPIWKERIKLWKIRLEEIGE